MSRLLASLIVDTKAKKISLTNYLYNNTEYYYSKKSIYKSVKKKEIQVNNKHQEPGMWVHDGDEIKIFEPEQKQNKTINIQISIQYEDDYLAIVEKPPGIVTTGYQQNSLENALAGNLQESTQPDKLMYAKPVHRLDKKTGGLVIAAKTQKTHIGLSKQFERREIKKVYQAVISGKLEGEGRIEQPVDSRDAVTRYIADIHSKSLTYDWLTLVNLYPETGRKHQLRKHLAAIGHPIIGDSIYSKDINVLKGKGLFLWAIGLELIHPVTSEKLQVKIVAPDKYKTYIQREQKRWEQFN